jgi:hypothetical protein
MKCTCGGNLTVTRTLVTRKGVKRDRKCDQFKCGMKIVTYERPKEDGLTEHEMRLVTSYRASDKPIRKALWSLLRSQN